MLTDDQTCSPPPTLRRGGSTDVTDHRNEIFFAAVSTTRMPMVVTDPQQPDNPIVFVNPAFLAMTGYAEEEIIGSNCRFLQGAETDPATVREVREAIGERREIATEILNYRKNGSTFWNALFISPVYNEDGDLVYFFASQLDVSRRRDAEDALRQSQKMEALGQLTGGIAHDFNNLLQVMTGYLDLLQVGLQNGSMPKSRMLQSVDNTRSAVQKAATLTQQLLAFARKQRLEGRTINLNALCDGMIELARRTLGEHIRLQTAYASDLPNCRIDPTQLEVALLNVLLNARDAIGNRENGTVAVRTSHLLVDAHNTVGYADLEPGSYVAIAVSDNGGGIAPDVIERVMDPFFTTKDIGKGTGLGLSMVYGFAKQSGGAVNLYSEQGVGTTIRLYFPAVDDEAKLVALVPRTIEQPGNGTILVVDDREEVAHVAQAMLEAIGYSTVTAHNAKDAITLLRSDRRIDMLFSDLIMPGGINGVMLAREARRIRPSIKILLTTGYADSSLERTDAGGGEFDIIHKPYRQAELLRRVRIVLDGPTGVG